MDEWRLDHLGRAECLALLSTTPVGRIGVSIGAMPVILPVNFAVLDDSIVFRTVPGTKLHAATRGAIVAFEADDYVPDGSSGWSVLAVGIASTIEGPVEVERARAVGIDTWAVADEASHFVRIETSRLTGRRFTRGGAR